MTDQVPIKAASGDIAQFVTGDTVPIANGGTGQTTATTAINALLPTQTANSGKYLTTDGSAASWGTIGAGDGVGGTLYLVENFI